MRRGAQHVVVCRRDCGQGTAAPCYVPGDGGTCAAAQRGDQRSAGVQEVPSASALKRDQGRHLRRRARGCQIGFGAAVGSEIFLRQVDPARAQVLGHVLPVLDQLQCSAHLVGTGGRGRRGGAEDVQDDPADRVRRQTAVTEQVVERLVARNKRVLPVWLDEGGQEPDRDPAVVDETGGPA